MRPALLILLAACSTTDPAEPSDERPPMMSGVSTLAGWAEPGYVDGPRDINLFHNPVNVAIGLDGRVYVADFDNNKLRVVEPDGSAATVLAMPRPFGLAFGGSTLFVQTDNDPTNAHTAMTGTLWAVDISAKTTRVIAQGIGRPRGVAALRDGMLAVTDYVHHVVEIVDPQTGTVIPLAGAWDEAGDADGAAARFAEPYGIVETADGSLLVADRLNNRIRRVRRDGTVTTFAGSDSGFTDGPLGQARFAHPQGLAIAGNGDVFVTDTDNYRVRRITGDAVETIAGTGAPGYGDDEDPRAALLFGLEGLAVTSDGGRVVVADGTRGEDVPYNRVRIVDGRL